MADLGGEVVSQGGSGGDGSGMKEGGGGPGGMVSCMVSREFCVEFKKGTDEAFDKHAEVRALVVKMEETGEPFKLESQDGKEFITGGRISLKQRLIFDKFFAGSDATKRILLTKLEFVGSTATRHRKTSKSEQENYPDEEWVLLELWVLKRVASKETKK
jgi:hypothetical protein